MFWRILLWLLKPAALAALFELLSPIGDALGLQFTFIVSLAWKLSNALNVPYRSAELMIVFMIAATLVKISKAVWDLATT